MKTIITSPTTVDVKPQSRPQFPRRFFQDGSMPLWHCLFDELLRASSVPTKRKYCKYYVGRAFGVVRQILGAELRNEMAVFFCLSLLAFWNSGFLL